MVEHLALAGMMLAGSMAAALSALLIVHLWTARGARAADRFAATQPEGAEDAVLLFQGATLLEASDGARALVSGLPQGGSAWGRFAAWAEARFPGFGEAMARLPQSGRTEMTALPPLRLRLMADWRHGLIRVALHDPDAEGRTVSVDRLSLAAAETELAQLRHTLDCAPMPVWRETPDGAVVWANPAYLRLAQALPEATGSSGGGGGGEEDAGGAGLGWPLPGLFGPRAGTTLPPGAATAAPAAMAQPARLRRRALRGASPGRPPHWFDCVETEAPDGARLCFALPADATVRAEAALQDLVQTLSRTFAHLPVGLAVFDRQRRLQIFNPALSDLTGLAPEFLISRPGFEGFFDALRSRQMIPEPRDYRAWRESLTEIERAAASGHYQEVWSLTDGQTWRVTGRPQPDGAVAFLIEDVSAEISLTRRFRAEIETGKAVLDTLDEAIAVFSPAGVLVMSNAAYAGLWGMAPDRLVGAVGIAEALEVWRRAAHPSPLWAELGSLAGGGAPGAGGMPAAGGPPAGGRAPWEGAVQLRDGRHVSCRVVPLAGGATLVGFRPVAGATRARPAAGPAPDAVHPPPPTAPRRAEG